MIFIQPSISPIALSFGFVDIRWYSLAYIFTFIIGSIIIKKLNKRSYNYLSENPNAIQLLEANLDKIYWAMLSINPAAIHILEDNLDKIKYLDLDFDLTSLCRLPLLQLGYFQDLTKLAF